MTESDALSLMRIASDFLHALGPVFATVLLLWLAAVVCLPFVLIWSVVWNSLQIDRILKKLR